MSEQGAREFVVGLIALFDRDPSDTTIEAYVRCLAECNDEDLTGAMQRVIRRSRFFPSTAELFEFVEEAREERAERERTSRPSLPPATSRRTPRPIPTPVRDQLEAMGLLRPASKQSPAETS